MLSGQRNRFVGMLLGLVQLPFAQIGLTEPRELHCSPYASRAHRGRGSFHPFEKIPTFSGTTREREPVAETGEDIPWLEVPHANNVLSAAQDLDGLVEVAAIEGHAAGSAQRLDK